MNTETAARIIAKYAVKEAMVEDAPVWTGYICEDEAVDLADSIYHGDFDTNIRTILKIAADLVRQAEADYREALKQIRKQIIMGIS